MAEVDGQPARSNESPILELLGAWKPSNKTGAQGFNPGTRSFSCILSWLDKVRLEEIRSKIKFGGMIEVCSDMRRGGGEL